MAGGEDGAPPGATKATTRPIPQANKKVGGPGKVSENRKNSQPPSPPVDLAKKNAEYAKLVNQLMKSIEKERKKHDEKVAEITDDFDHRIREIEDKCDEEKQELLARNEEVENELHVLLEKQSQQQPPTKARSEQSPRSSSVKPDHPTSDHPTNKMRSKSQGAVPVEDQIRLSNDLMIKNDLQMRLASVSAELEMRNTAYRVKLGFFRRSN